MRIPLRRHARDGRSVGPDLPPETDFEPASSPPRPVLRLVRRDTCARHADDLERELAGHTRRIAFLRFVRGRLAREFLLRKSWSALGFVRVSDYARECLGLAARTLQEDARAARALDRLPQITIAFLEGRLTWTQVRHITLVAWASDEAEWIATALECDARTLEEKTRRRARESGVAVPDAPGEPVTDFQVRVSREGRRLWRAVYEMAERNAGSPLTPAQVLELVAAEASSGAPRADGHLDEAFRVLPAFAPSPTVPQEGLVDASLSTHPFDGAADVSPQHRSDQCVDGSVPSYAYDQTADTFLTSHAHADVVDRDPLLTKFLAEIRAEQDAATAAGLSWTEYVRRADAAVPTLEDAAALLRAHLERIAAEEHLPSIVPVRRGASATDRLEELFDLFESREPRALDARMREIGRALQRADAELARLLREALDTRLHRARGFESFARYVDERLDFCSRTAWTLIAMDRAASRVGGEFGRAYREGEISLLAAQALLPVLGPRHASAWIDRARSVTLRRLEAEVSWALDQRDAATGSEAFDQPAPPPPDADLSPDSSVLDMAQLKMRAPSGEGADEGTSRPMGVTLRIRVPLSVAQLAETALLALRRDFESRGQAFERMLATVLVEWASAPRHRDPVFDRDGWRCAVPGCSSRRNLHDHHVEFRSHGGDNSRENRITICAAHHLHGVHAGRVRATGVAPSELVWELGCDSRTSRPYARFVGDRYVLRPTVPARNFP